MNEKGEKNIDVISVSQALQIAGRAGRYGTQFDKVESCFIYCYRVVVNSFKVFNKGLFVHKGFVTTFKQEDLPILQNLMNQSPEPINQAGLHPTAEQIELYAYHLPHSTLSNLIVSSLMFYFILI